MGILVACLSLKVMDTMRFTKILSIVSLLLLLAACSGMPEDQTANWSVEDFYKTAKQALDNEDYLGAANYYTQLEARYPYGVYAQQSQLDIIFAYHKANEPASAVAAADRFIKLHPRHPNVDYAYYMRGLVTYDQNPSLFTGLFAKDPSKRDPAALRESFNYFKELVTRYPASQYTKDAIERMKVLRNHLAKHELQVANYYLQRGSYLAAANRAKYVLENYQRSESVPGALAMQVKAYRLMKMPDLAKDALRVLKKNYPDYPGLADLQKETKPAPVIP
jgi:outer membrane protein assembly factor BamD